MPDSPSTRPLLDKLGVKPGANVVLVGEFSGEFRALLATRTDAVYDGPAAGPADLIFYEARDLNALDALPELRKALASNGAIWVVRAKGKLTPFNENHVIAAAKRHGLVDNKVVSFSDSLSALRLVIPRSLR
jgi:hypothetical protein